MKSDDLTDRRISSITAVSRQCVNQGSVTEHRYDRYTLLIGGRAVALVRWVVPSLVPNVTPAVQDLCTNVWYIIVSTAVKKVKVAADHRKRERQ